jgi:flagellar biogenesis protein FliO
MKASGNGETEPANGLAVWLLERLRGRRRRSLPRLALLERIALAPRQSLALVEAEGRRFLVATSPDGSPAFYPLDGPVGSVMAGRPGATQSARVSW